MIADQISKVLRYRKSQVRKLRIFASGDILAFQKKLRKIGIRNNVVSL